MHVEGLARAAMNQDLEGERRSCSSGMTHMDQVTDSATDGKHGSCSSGMAGVNLTDSEGERGSCFSGMTGMNKVTDLVTEGEHGSYSSGLDGNKGSEGLHAIANFYDKLCPAWEDAVQDVDCVTVPQIPHENTMEGVQRALQSAIDVMGGRLNCRELEAMDLLCVEGGDILSRLQVATFHAYWHRFMSRTETDPPDLAVEQGVATNLCGQMALARSMAGAMQLQREGGPSMAGFCMSHICSIWGWIGLEEAYGGTNYEEDAAWLKGALHASNQLAGLRSELCLPLRYALGEFLYTTAFHNCNGNEGKQTILFNMALPELMVYGRDVAQENEVALDVFTVFSRAGKVAIKLQKDLSELMEVYNEVAMYARKIGQGKWERLLSLLCSGLQELENDKTAAGFKIFVEVLKCGVKLADGGDDLLSNWFDLLSHACWWTNKSMRSLEFGHVFPRLIMPTLEEFVRASVGTSKALLGNALFVLGQEVEGLHYLESVHKMIEGENLDPTLHQAQKFLAQSYAGRHSAQDHRKAAEMYEAASKTAPDLQIQLTMDVAAASQWVKVPEEFVRGLEGMQAAVHIAFQRLPHEWEFQAFLFFKVGDAFLDIRDMERGFEYMEAGWSLCAANDLAFAAQEERKYAKDIVVGLAQLLGIYLDNEKLSAALALYKAVDPILSNLRSTTNESPMWIDSVWRCWQQVLEALNKATGFPADEVPQWEIPIGRYSWDLESMLKDDLGGGTTYLFAAADHYEDMVAKKSEAGDWTGAVDALNILEDKLLRKGVLSTKAKVLLQVNRTNLLCSGGEFLHALEEVQKAVDMMLDAEADPWLLTEIYIAQASTYWRLRNPDAAHASLDMAEKNLSNGKNSSRSNIMKLRSLLLQQAGQYEAAAQLTCEVAHLCRATQSNLGLESAWVPFLEGTQMPVIFKVAALQYLLQEDMPKALIWAERGRTRLFMHRVNQLEAEKFDESDQYAEDILYKTIELCGPSTVIIECSIFHQMAIILSALVDHPVVGKRCATKTMDLNKFFKIEANCAAGKSINEIVVNVRKHIRAGNDDKAMPGLTILHSMLVQSILDQYHELRNCTSIIFAPEGFLHLIPFTALYDGIAEKFLIEQKAVGVIPSIRSLHNCFSRQHVLENRVQVLDDAFIAGNPEPMGLEFSQLPGAAEEAQQVAEILGVEACKGENITKEAVVRALAKSSVVLLATHGLGESHKYLSPYGGIVLKKAHLDNNSDQAENLDSPSDQQEVLTFDEVVAIEGGISAGLVVISACFPLTGGNVFEEGLLSLGRAVLQAGAASAIVSLWNVNDEAMRILIVDVFKELKKGTDILHSAQKAMVKMLRGPQPTKLQHWSALTVLGSPTFQLPGHKQAAAEVNLKQHNIDYYRGSQLSADDIKGNVMYPRAVVHQFRNMVWQQEDEGNWAAGIATVDDLEERLQKNGIVSAVAKSKLHLSRGKYLNQSKGGSWKALKELQKSIEVLADTKEMAELVAEIFLERAKAFFRVKDRDATTIALEKAQESVAKCKDNILLYNIKVFRSLALNEAGEFEAAAALAREAQLDAGLGTMSMWVPFVDNAGLQNSFSVHEIESREQGDVNKALLWAERGRTIVSEDDGNDSVAIRSMLKTVNFCGSHTVIIYLSYHHQNMLLLYGFSSKASACMRLFLRRFFKDETNRVMGSSLEEVVSRVRQHITKGEDKKAIPGLSILYNLLVKNIVVEFKELFASSMEIIFAPQGFLCHIPFAALYDATSNKFLVEQMAVGLIPSIRSLSHCFSQQEIFESSFKLKEDLSAFISGNPEPMALGLDQLPGTCQVANAVAGIMNVEALLGSKITKEALLESLVTRNTVMLATHGVGSHREQPYPYGAMVLKQDSVAAHQLLTCEDIAALAGKIKAGLVVLIACHKGDQAGMLSRDGLLGLGHAALEAGAVSAIASLWDVNEDTLEPLISAIFTELLQGSDVLHSVQKAMKDTLRSREIRHWASLTVLGSPTLRIATQPQPDVAAPESQDSNGTGNTFLATDLDTLRKGCQEAFRVTTEDGLTTLDNLPQGVVETVLQQLVDQYGARILQAEREGDLATEIIQCSNLSRVYGAMGEWNTCREWVVHSVTVAKENWEQVKEDDNVVCRLPNSGILILNLLHLHGSTNVDMDLELANFVRDMAC